MKPKNKEKEENLLSSDYNKKRIRHMQLLLLEAVVGNFSCRLDLSGRDDSLDALMSMLNMVMEELEALFIHKAYKESEVPSINLTAFTLDQQWCIRALHPHVADLLSRNARDMIGRPLEQFLTEESQTVWEKVKKVLERNKAVNETVKVFFTTGNHLVFPVRCNISTLCSGHKQVENILSITFHQASHQQGESPEHLLELHKKKILELKNNKRIILRNTDVHNLHNIHNYIQRHPEGPIPSLKNLAHMFGVNEFKLKYGFKQLYGTSVFRYYREERLKRVKLLIQSTAMPLKDIARITGFKDASHFTRAFKKRYGYCPKKLKDLPVEKV